jgi:hypothetical protein
VACDAGLGHQETTTTTAAAAVAAIAGRSGAATGSGGTPADGDVSVIITIPDVVFKRRSTKPNRLRRQKRKGMHPARKTEDKENKEDGERLTATLAI